MPRFRGPAERSSGSSANALRPAILDVLHFSRKGRGKGSLLRYSPWIGHLRAEQGAAEKCALRYFVSSQEGIALSSS